MYIPTRREVKPRETLSQTNLSRIGIPRLFFDAEIDDYHSEGADYKILRNYVKYIHDMFEDCVNLTLYGSNGSGKTFVTSIILKNAYRYYYSAKRTTFTYFMSISFKPDKAEDDKEYLRQVFESEFLVIDELGKENNLKTLANISLLENLMKYREEKGLPTIICTNFTLEGIKEKYGDTIHSLVMQSVRLEMIGNDLRNEVFKKRGAIALLQGDDEE